MQRWIQYLNSCVAVSASEVVEAPGASVPFSLKTILVDMEEARYTGMILSNSIAAW